MSESSFFAAHAHVKMFDASINLDVRVSEIHPHKVSGRHILGASPGRVEYHRRRLRLPATTIEESYRRFPALQAENFAKRGPCHVADDVTARTV